MVRTSKETLSGRVANNETQVLNKRKPVNLITATPDVPDNVEVYVMKGTNEVFTDYEKYLKRFDWLNQKKFTDAVNGKSGLTYWDALESETKSQANIETLFPEVLRDPILRSVQFSTISRMDELVNKVFDDFKSDYFPGEEVVCTLDNGEQFEGTIREKAKFPMIRGADGSVQRAPFSRYFIKVHHTPNEEALLDDKHIRRDRKVFTKQNLRAFLKNSLQREAWSGAPWLVKEHLAIQYRLPMEIPQHLFQDAKMMAAKTQMLTMRPPKNKKPKNMSPAEFERLRHEELQLIQRQLQHQQMPGAPPPPVGHYQQQQQQHHQMMNQVQPRAPPPPVIKYPIEDLDLPPKRNGTTRPELKFFNDELAEYMRSGRKTAVQGIEMKSVGMLLEVWNTLNVQCEVYVLDSFTFDDFVEAMQYQELDFPCELLDEIHCAVLKLFVDESGKVLVKDMPRKKVEESPADDDTDGQDDSEISTPLPDVPARSTRSRLSHMEVAEPQSPVAENRNQAVEMIGDRTWEERIAARDFSNGGWQVILVGILHQLSQIPSYKETCEKVLAHLAPIDEPPTPTTAMEQYASMDVNLRIAALQMLTVLTIRTEAIKDFLETCMDDMTDVRKRKIEHQREKKLAMEEFAVKDREFKILLPDHLPPSPKTEPTEAPDQEATEDSIDLNGSFSSPEPGEGTPGGRSLRRGGDRKRKREEDQARREKEKAEKAEAAKAHNKAAKEFKKIEKECTELKERIRLQEEKIAECDSDLREANVQRTKVLGKDRFCNRYYWFERNGQPFGGLPSSSTSSYGYANGRIWVQGPDVMEREGLIDRTPEEQKEYQRIFQTTVPQRRQQEEGGVPLESAEEWGYIDDPDRLDNLIGWLDDRGERERKLRKELLEWRDRIAQYMEAYKNFMDQEAAKKLETEEESGNRISTRHKQAEEESAQRARCLRWTNTMAIDEQGHIHSQPPKPKEKKSKKQAAEREDRGRGVAVPVNRGKR
ncbi:uncharacterized protein RHO25_009758 [Cercospora beticola]|uniref:Imitation switch two complex protein 1 n=1 Tax=Cercospora beticola TaxID=122368 RepID=A0ABZ0NZT8_CERBT|nr:hypothetical protein RHO25_009758 [Cercospora beticola]